MRHIFISYQRSWEEKVVELSDCLSKSGFSVWRDNSGKELGIPFSIKWWDVVEEALYDAVGTLIIDTKEWKESTPCHKEYELIINNSIPKLNIVQEELEDMDGVVERIKEWYAKDVDNQGNYLRAYLFGQGYRYYKNPKISRLLPGKFKFFEAVSQYRKYKEMEGYLEESRVTVNNPEMDRSIRQFLSKAKRRIIGSQVYKLFFAFYGIIIALVVYTLISLMPYLKNASDKTSQRNRTAGMIDVIDEVGKYNPVSAMNMLTDGYTIPYTDAAQSFFLMASSMVDYLDRKYPLDFYRADSDKAKNIMMSGRETESVLSMDEKGQPVVMTGDVRRVLDAECIPTADCFVPERNELFVAYDNVIVAYDLDNTMQGIELAYNFETIDRIVYQEEMVYGITVTGNVVCWKNPIQEKQINHKLENGYIFKDGSAIYVYEDKLAVQQGGKERFIDLPYVAKKIFAVSHSEAAVAVVCENDHKNIKIVEVDIKEGTINSEYESPVILKEVAFSKDDSMIYGVAGNGLLRVVRKTGKVDFKNSQDTTYFGMVDYQDGCIVSDVYGTVSVFNSDLVQKTGWLPANGCYAIPKQMAVSEKYKTLFCSNRSGNALAGCGKLYIETGNLSYLPVNMEPGLVSNTSVTVSDDGEFLAYGFPNGQVMVYDVNNLDLLYENRSVAENIIQVRFGTDCLFGLGTSGTVYRFDFDGLVRIVNNETVSGHWLDYVEKSEEIQRKMYELGLSDIVVK